MDIRKVYYSLPREGRKELAKKANTNDGYLEIKLFRKSSTMIPSPRLMEGLVTAFESLGLSREQVILWFYDRHKEGKHEREK